MGGDIYSETGERSSRQIWNTWSSLFGNGYDCIRDFIERAINTCNQLEFEEFVRLSRQSEVKCVEVIVNLFCQAERHGLFLPDPVPSVVFRMMKAVKLLRWQ